MSSVLTERLVTDLHADWTNYKETNERRLKDLEKGRGTAEIDQKLDRIDNAMNQNSERLKDLQSNISARVDEIEQVMAGYARMDPGIDEKQIIRDSCLLKSWATGRPLDTVEPMDREQYSAYCKDLYNYLRRGTVTNDMQVGGDPQGGYWVTPDLSGRIVNKIYETSNVRPLANVTTISTDRLRGSNDLGEAGYGWVGERETRAVTTTPDIGEWEIMVHEYYAQPRVTQTLLEDADVDPEMWLGEKVSEVVSRAENKAFVVGDGVKQPRGFLTYSHATATLGTELPTATNWDQVQRIFTGKTAGNGIDDATFMMDVLTELKPEYLGNAGWIMNRRELNAVRKIFKADAAYLFVPDFSKSPYGMILMHPVNIMEDMPMNLSTTVAPNVYMAFGDLRAAYQIVDRRGMRVLRDPYTDKPWIKLYCTGRVGGGLINYEAIKYVSTGTS